MKNQKNVTLLVTNISIIEDLYKKNFRFAVVSWHQMPFGKIDQIPFSKVVLGQTDPKHLQKQEMEALQKPQEDSFNM
jgi:hypothetical protein